MDFHDPWAPGDGQKRSGMHAEAVWGQEEVAQVTDPAAYVPVKTLAPYEISIIKLGATGP